MIKTVCKVGVKLLCLVGILLAVPDFPAQTPARTVLLEVLRSSWDFQRDETLVYLRVYSDGFAEAHSMRKIDLRKGKYLACRHECCRQGGDGICHRDESEHDSAVYRRAAWRFAGHF